MLRRNAVWFEFCLILMGVSPVAVLAERPNIVVIMADDLGWRDLHCYGNKQLDTPFIDRLAEQGMKFTNAYAASPVCSPTRAAMMTGLAPARLRLTNHAPGNADLFALEGSNLQEAVGVRHLDTSYRTIAEHLQDAGYATAHIGKWHLSYVQRAKANEISEAELTPEAQGFDMNVGGTRRGGPPTYFSPYRNPKLPDGVEGEYLPERLADEAISFVKASRDKPFYLNWWPFSVHYPLEAREKTIEKYRNRSSIKDPAYAAMIEGMDQAIGRFLNALDELGLRENTLVIFKSDNGGYNGDNRPLRGFKGMIYEGGMRIPWIVRWPGVVEPNSTCDIPVISMDCFPTLLEVAIPSAKPSLVLDGRSLMPILTQTGELDREAIYFHYPNYAFHKKNRLASAVRFGDHKLIKRYDDGSIELYNLVDDLGERKNLAKSKPALAEKLHNRLDRWLAEVDASLPTRKER